MGKIPNSPLIEAIFELRWGEKKTGNFAYSTDELEFFPGIFSQEIKKMGYTHSEQLIPETENAIFPYRPRHRFRKSENEWPCFQIGVGIFTANQVGRASLEATEENEYDWDDFKPVIETGLKALDASYPSGIENIPHPQAILRYQDGFILENETIESFVTNKIKADIKIPNVFTDQPHINNNAKNIKLEFAYETDRPNGRIIITISSAQISGERGIVIDTAINTNFQDKNISVQKLLEWCEEAHDLQRHTFETLIPSS